MSLLDDSFLPKLPVKCWKSHILTLECELVRHVTAWLDEPRLTLVPYRGRTLVANGRRVPAHNPSAARDCIPEEVEILKGQLREAYPHLRSKELKILSAHGCLKTEIARDDRQNNQESAIFDESYLGVAGLTVVFPGKASLAFQLAQRVVRQIGSRERDRRAA